MSRVVTKNLSDCPVDVIVRAFGDEPAHLRAVLVRPKVVEVIGEDESLPMGFYEEDVFCFEIGLFERMRRAYSKGDKDRLSRLWAGATRFNSEALPPKPRD